MLIPSRRRRAVSVSVFVVAVSALAASPASAQKRGLPPSDYGFDFVTVGATGNRAVLPSEMQFPHWDQIPQNFGVVNKRYRIATTQVTATHWIDFVNAYDPYWTAAGGSRFDSRFTSTFIRPSTANPNVPANYSIFAGLEHSAIEVSWYVAARYVNWLHNGKVNEQWAFENGAYDTSTFGVSPPGTPGFIDQKSRSPDALFWLPDIHEWTKAAHYDPNRYGEGQEGYWFRTGGQNDPLLSGRPEDGGETSAGQNFPDGFSPQTIPVGSYPHVQSPWGLLDTSGAAKEWTESLGALNDIGDGTHGRSRVMRGSEYGGNHFDLDVIDHLWDHSPVSGTAGIRLASVIPAPSAAVIVIAAVALRLPTRRRPCTIHADGFSPR